MKLTAALVIASFLSGCRAPNPIKDAEDQLAIVQNTGDRAEICVQARVVQKAWLNAKNEERFREAKLHADVYCQSLRDPLS